MAKLLPNYMAIVCDYKYNIVNATDTALYFLKYKKIEEIEFQSITIIMPSTPASFHTYVFEEMNKMTNPQVIDAKNLATDKMNNILDPHVRLTVDQLEETLSKELSIKELIQKDGSSIYARMYIDFQSANNTIVYIKPLSQVEESNMPTVSLTNPIQFHRNGQLVSIFSAIKKIRNSK
jgi:hypothetical protein